MRLGSLITKNTKTRMYFMANDCDARKMKPLVKKVVRKRSRKCRK